MSINTVEGTVGKIGFASRLNLDLSFVIPASWKRQSDPPQAEKDWLSL